MYTYRIEPITLSSVYRHVLPPERQRIIDEINNKYFVARYRTGTNPLTDAQYLLQDQTWSTTAAPDGQPLGYFNSAQEAIENLSKSLQCNKQPAQSNSSDS